MNILFITSKDGDLNNYKKIIQTINNLDHNVIDEEFFLAQTTQDIIQTSYDELRSFKNRLDKSDIVIAEITSNSLSLGLQIAAAVERGKPVLILFNESLNKLDSLAKSFSTKFTVIKAYNSSDKIRTVLQKGIEETSRLLQRKFNLIISSETYQFLEEYSKISGLSKSEIMRKAIRDLMRNFTY